MFWYWRTTGLDLVPLLSSFPAPLSGGLCRSQGQERCPGKACLMFSVNRSLSQAVWLSVCVGCLGLS